MTAEKQAPSPIDILGAMKEAVAIEKRLAKAGVSKALRDVLSRCVGEYNKMVSKRSHKIDTPTKNLVMNMFLEQNTIELYTFTFSFQFNDVQRNYLLYDGFTHVLRLRTDDAVHQAIHRHYDSFPHAQSGWVPKIKSTSQSSM